METSRSLTRRHALRLFGGAALAAIPALRVAGEAAAGTSWCRSDPWVVINGIHLNVFPERDANVANTCSEPIELVFSVTPGSLCAVLNQDAGFGYGYTISFVETAKVGTSQYKVDMYVPATTAMAVRLVCDPIDPTAKTTIKGGSANTWLTVGTKF